MSKKTSISILTSLLLGVMLFATLAGLSKIQAQNKELSVAIVSLEEYQSKKEELIKLYGQQIQLYQESHRQYSIAKTQYQKLGTLTSLGELVDIARETMKQRGEVMITYVDILYLELQFASNTDPGKKQDLLDDLEALHNDLQYQQGLITGSQDYQAINARAEAFAGILKRLEIASIQTKALIYTGRIQAADLDSRNFFTQIEEQYKQNPGTNIKAVERQRVKDEISDAFVKVETLWADAEKVAQRDSDANQGWYNSYVAKLVAVQNQLLLVLSYLKEASQL